MEQNDETLVLSEGFAIEWEMVKTLKVLNNKLMLVMKDDLVVEVSGLPARQIDATFAAYSRYLRQNQGQSVSA